MRAPNTASIGFSQVLGKQETLGTQQLLLRWLSWSKLYRRKYSCLTLR